MSILGAILKGTLGVAKTAAVQHARSQMAQPAPGRRKKKNAAEGCTPCAAKKTAAAMWNKNDKMMGLDKGWK